MRLIKRNTTTIFISVSPVIYRKVNHKGKSILNLTKKERQTARQRGKVFTLKLKVLLFKNIFV